MSDARGEDSPVAQVFHDASDAVLDDRGETHGGIHENFGQTASFWSDYLDADVTPTDVAVMMVLMKASRQKCGSEDPDHYTDIAGYAAIANGLSNGNSGTNSGGED
jgi:hypothetical protein